MKYCIILLFIILGSIEVYAQTNTVVKSITKKTTRESTEKVLKKTAKEVSEELEGKTTKKLSEEIADPVQKRAIRKAVSNNYNKISLEKRKESSLNSYKKRQSINHPRKSLSIRDWKIINEVIDNKDKKFLCKIFNITPNELNKAIRYEITDQINYHSKTDIKMSMYLVKQRIKELQTNPQLIKLLKNNDFIINENTLFHLFARHGNEYKFLKFDEIINLMKEIKSKGVRTMNGNNIVYTYKKRRLIYRSNNSHPYVISMFTIPK